MKQKILIVEDDKAILTGLTDLLSAEGYTTVTATDGKQALALYAQHKPDLVLLDLMLPEKSGYEVCREIRKKDPQTAIVMLTAKQQEVDKVVGLELGADDYLIKPFSVNELLARIHAALRRATHQPARKYPVDPLQFGHVVIDPKTLTGRRGKKSFAVSPRELHLLQLFTEHPGEVLDRFTLLDEVWGITYEGTTRTLDQHLVKLRQKIEDDPAHPRHLLTVHGAGYRFVP